MVDGSTHRVGLRMINMIKAGRRQSGGRSRRVTIEMLVMLKLRKRGCSKYVLDIARHDGRQDGRQDEQDDIQLQCGLGAGMLRGQRQCDN